MATPGSPEEWLHRLSQILMHKQDKYRNNENYAIGNHPVPKADPRYVKALADFQKKAKTNYIGLAIKAVTDRMKVVDFKFGEQTADPDARKFWKFNNMNIQSAVAIENAAKFSDCYAMVSPPGPDGIPFITIEDPRQCIVEPDPLNPMRGVAGLKLYEDVVAGNVVAVLLLPAGTYVFIGPSREDFLQFYTSYTPDNILSGSAFVFESFTPNPFEDGRIPLVRAVWQPQYGVYGMAECEDGGYEIQDRINFTVLSRIVITNSQAFRQKWMTGVEVPTDRNGAPLRKSPFDPGSDIIWAVPDEKAKFGDFDQADITQLLAAVEADVGDFAAITQTPVSYLTNKMVNVSGDTLSQAKDSLIAKVKCRMEPMGWFFEEIIKLCFKYQGDSRADEIDAQTLWADPERRSGLEIADMMTKLVTSGVPLGLAMEVTGVFTQDQIEAAVAEAKAEKLRQEQVAMDQTMASKPEPGTTKPTPSSGSR